MSSSTTTCRSAGLRSVSPAAPGCAILLALLDAGLFAACAPAEAPRAVESPAPIGTPAAPADTVRPSALVPKVVATEPGLDVDQRSNVFVDARDGQRYPVVRVGERDWLAENLRYVLPGSFCYDELESHCARMGRLYQWDAAMKACPRGWHLPSEEEWQAVEDASPDTIEPLLQGGRIGFEIVMAGERRTDGRYQDLGSNFYFWTSTTLEDRARLRWNLTESGLQIATDVKTEGYSVRCVGDR